MRTVNILRAHQPYADMATVGAEDPEQRRPRINIVLNWSDELRTKVPR